MGRKYNMHTRYKEAPIKKLKISAMGVRTITQPDNVLSKSKTFTSCHTKQVSDVSRHKGGYEIPQVPVFTIRETLVNLNRRKENSAMI